MHLLLSIFIYISTISIQIKNYVLQVKNLCNRLVLVLGSKSNKKDLTIFYFQLLNFFGKQNYKYFSNTIFLLILLTNTIILGIQLNFPFLYKRKLSSLYLCLLIYIIEKCYICLIRKPLIKSH